MESLSAYARQFLDQMRKPDLESIDGLPPTIAIEQRGGGHTPRSTVATTTEVYDYLRLLYARAGRPTCWHRDDDGRRVRAGDHGDEPEPDRGSCCWIAGPGRGRWSAVK